MLIFQAESMMHANSVTAVKGAEFSPKLDLKFRLLINHVVRSSSFISSFFPCDNVQCSFSADVWLETGHYFHCQNIFPKLLFEFANIEN